jgi:hypothetical protein
MTNTMAKIPGSQLETIDAAPVGDPLAMNVTARR